MHLFSKPKTIATPPVPTVDEAALAIQDKKQASQLTSRAASMLTANPAATTGKQTVTGY